MGDTRFTLKEIVDAKKKIESLFAAPEQVNVIHYSCETFLGDDRPHSPRIAAIVIMNLETSETVSFSLAKEADLAKIDPKRIRRHLKQLELSLLEAFYNYVKDHPQSLWLHWNMRDAKYGFEALENRFRALGKSPTRIDPKQRYDLSQLLSRLYGRKPAEHPRLITFIEKNNLPRTYVLTGEEEAKEFDRGNFIKLRNSTLNKARAIAQIARLARKDELLPEIPTSSKWGLGFGTWIDNVVKHWLFTLAVIVSTLYGVLQAFGIFSG